MRGIKNGEWLIIITRASGSSTCFCFSFLFLVSPESTPGSRATEMNNNNNNWERAKIKLKRAPLSLHRPALALAAGSPLSRPVVVRLSSPIFVPISMLFVILVVSGSGAVARPVSPVNRRRDRLHAVFRARPAVGVSISLPVSIPLPVSVSLSFAISISVSVPLVTGTLRLSIVRSAAISRPGPGLRSVLLGAVLLTTLTNVRSVACLLRQRHSRGRCCNCWRGLLYVLCRRCGVLRRPTHARIISRARSLCTAPLAAVIATAPSVSVVAVAVIA